MIREIPRLEFFPVEHKYVYDGRELPNVTRILDRAGCIDKFGFTDECRARGTYVHQATALLDRGEDVVTLEHYAPYIVAYRSFLRHMEPVWSRTEHAVCDPVYGYAGTLDRAGMVQGQPVVVDIKTGEVPASVGPQTAAYRRCLADAHRWQRYCLQLRPDGDYRWLPLADRHDESVFLAALTLYQWREKHGVRQGVAA